MSPKNTLLTSLLSVISACSLNLQEGSATPGKVTDGTEETGTIGDDGGSGNSDGSSDGGSSDGGSSDGGTTDGTGGDTSGGTDGTGGDTSGGTDGSDGTTSTALDTRDPDDPNVDTTTGEVSVDADCTMSYTRYAPESGTPIATVIAAHGFSRSSTQMGGWAWHFASWGFEVYTPDLCHLSIWDTDHEANGEELVLFANAVASQPVIYLGHSAGGLAALLATAADSSALGGVGLDPVDFLTTGADQAATLTHPFHALFGEGSFCNSSNNGIDFVDGGGIGWRVVDADHCDFENPTDIGCTAACNNYAATLSADEIGEVVRAMSTAALFGLSGDTATFDAWWARGGTYLDPLLTDGRVSGL